MEGSLSSIRQDDELCVLSDMAYDIAKERVAAYAATLVPRADDFDALVKRRTEAKKAKGTIPASRVQVFETTLRRIGLQNLGCLGATLPSYVREVYTVLLHVWYEHQVDPRREKLDAVDAKFAIDLQLSAEHFVCRLGNRINKFTKREKDVGHRVGQSQRNKPIQTKGERRVQPYERVGAKKHGDLLGRIAPLDESNKVIEAKVGDLLGRVAPLDESNKAPQPDGGDLLVRIAPLRNGNGNLAPQSKTGDLLGRIAPLGGGTKVLQPKAPNAHRGPKVGTDGAKLKGETGVGA